MGIGISVLLLAAGAILTFAMDLEVSGINLDAVGVIIMIVGAIGLLWALMTAETLRRDHERVVER